MAEDADVGASDGGADEDRSLTDRAAARAAELSGELPAFVREALPDREPPADEADGGLSEDQEQTVEALTDLGLDEQTARRAVREERVPVVLAQQSLGEPPRFTLEELSERSGVPENVLREVRVALGLPLPERFSRTDLRWAELLHELLEVVPPESLVRNARARGSALAAIARVDMSLVADEIVQPMREAGADDLTVSVALAETAGALGEVARELLVVDYELHLQQVLGSELSAMAARSESGEMELAVGFVDVVGYTALSARVDPSGLDEILDSFEERAVAVVAGVDDVHLVKYLGDAVMMVAPGPVPLADALVELTTEVPVLEDAPLRGGMAGGEVLIREGDFFGPPVNMAARLTDVARPWTTLADSDLAPALEGSFGIPKIRPTRVRGAGLLRPLSVRPLPDDDDG